MIKQNSAMNNMIMQIMKVLYESLDFDYELEDGEELVDPEMEQTATKYFDTILKESNYDVDVAAGRLEARFKRLFIFMYKALQAVQEMDQTIPLLRDSEKAEYESVMTIITESMLNSEKINKSALDAADIREAVLAYNNLMQEFGRVIKEGLESRIQEVHSDIEICNVKPRPRF